MKSNLIQQKSYAFAIRIIKLYTHLTKSKKEFVLSKQVLRSGTSIGANIEEAIGGQSKSDFIAKMAIAYKESRETSYWIRLLNDTGFLSEKETLSLISDVEELLKIITAIQKSSKK